MEQFETPSIYVAFLHTLCLEEDHPVLAVAGTATRVIRPAQWSQVKPTARAVESKAVPRSSSYRSQPECADPNQLRILSFNTLCKGWCARGLRAHGCRVQAGQLGPAGRWQWQGPGFPPSHRPPRCAPLAAPCPQSSEWGHSISARTINTQYNHTKFILKFPTNRPWHHLELFSEYLHEFCVFRQAIFCFLLWNTEYKNSRNFLPPMLLHS